MKTKVLKLLALALLGTIYGCSTDPYRIKPTAERNVVEICAAGLDRSVTAKLDAQLKYKGGAADVEFKNSLRGAILNMLAEQNLPPEDRAKTLENIFDKYQKCIDTRMKEEAAVGRRMSVLACKNSCCKQDDCAKDCPMVEI